MIFKLYKMYIFYSPILTENNLHFYIFKMLHNVWFTSHLPHGDETGDGTFDPHKPLISRTDGKHVCQSFSKQTHPMFWSGKAGSLLSSWRTASTSTWNISLGWQTEQSNDNHVSNLLNSWSVFSLLNIEWPITHF